jgi:hypothetical protein
VRPLGGRPLNVRHRGVLPKHEGNPRLLDVQIVSAIEIELLHTGFNRHTRYDPDPGPSDRRLEASKEKVQRNEKSPL